MCARHMCLHIILNVLYLELWQQRDRRSTIQMRARTPTRAPRAGVMVLFCWRPRLLSFDFLFARLLELCTFQKNPSCATSVLFFMQVSRI
jgi:hypothetical protein